VGLPPLPPHERTWRHPSELAAAERQAVRTTEAATSTRTFAIATGTVGLVAVGMLMFAVTPRQQESPIAISATTTPIAPGEGRALASALATPIGDGGQALMTLSAIAPERGDELDVRLTSGPVVTAVVDGTSAGLVIVSITSELAGHEIADDLPGPDEIVTVMADPPVTVAFSAVDTVEADEGTPVLDSDGNLVGLCTQFHDGGSVAVIDVTDAPPIDDPRVVATNASP
jgi:hypothetical protein